MNPSGKSKARVVSSFLIHAKIKQTAIEKGLDVMNPFARLLLKLIASSDIDIRQDYERVRKLRRLTSRIARPVKKMYSVMDSQIFSEDYSHEIPVRIFHPKKLRHEEAILFFHGGGWVTGDIETYTSACIHMADALGRKVYSVDYRLAPENPFPAGLDDCMRVAEVVMENLSMTGVKSPSDWVLMGDSSGANLAAAVSLRLRDEGKRVPAQQILLYPVTHWDHTEASPFETVRTKGRDYGLTAQRIQDYMEMYQPELEKRKSAYVAPLMAKDFANQPRTLIVTAEHDLLRDEGEAYGKELEQAGNEVQIHRVAESAHGFITLPPFTKPVKETFRVINDFLKEGPAADEKEFERR
ncbi:alpha/beta hydrolase [Atopococcus tabaci]|uniref:alpha/beta hydrolase n=1 Tax=Atopococcus tabaci TaxID=269774 RepID=UPI002409A59F|nr:alpha/beta hydrolase [Atopococcus tabaci]